MTCTLAVFQLGVAVLFLSVADVTADMCRSWSDMYTTQGYHVRREWHKPQRQLTQKR